MKQDKPLRFDQEIQNLWYEGLPSSHAEEALRALEEIDAEGVPSTLAASVLDQNYMHKQELLFGTIPTRLIPVLMLACVVALLVPSYRTGVTSTPDAIDFSVDDWETLSFVDDSGDEFAMDIFDEELTLLEEMI